MLHTVMCTRCFSRDVPLKMTWVFSQSKIAWQSGDIATTLDWLRTGLLLEGRTTICYLIWACRSVRQEVNRLILVNQGFPDDSTMG
jgi:hypothetical protein